VILTVTLNPAVDQQIFVNGLKIGDTNRVARTEIDAGGKGVNLSRVFAELGGDTIATGFVGGNPGAIIRRVLNAQGCSDHFVEISGETRVNVSVEDDSGNPPTTFNEKGPVISEHEWDELKKRVRMLSASANWVCMGGSLPPGLPVTAYRELTEIVNCNVMVDADGEPAKAVMLAKPHFVKPNIAEAERFLGRKLPDTEAVVEGALEIRSQLEDSAVVVISRGEDGAVLACSQGTFLGTSAPVEARSTIGSGDSFLAGMLWAMEDGQPLLEAFRWGLAAGAATATTNGLEIARRRVIELLHAHTQVRPV
jgi:1-phosphofructokinase family hexose kinase